MGEFLQFMVEFFRDPRRNLGTLMLFVAGYAFASFLPVVQQGLIASALDKFLMVFSIAAPTALAAWFLLSNPRSKTPANDDAPS